MEHEKAKNYTEFVYPLQQRKESDINIKGRTNNQRNIRKHTIVFFWWNTAFIVYLIFTDLTIPQDCFRWPRFLENMTISAQFHLPLATQAFQAFSSLIHDLHSLTLSQSEKNCWSYIWGNGYYCSSKFYNFLFQGLSASTPFKWIWKSRCVMKLKVFAWLLLMDRLNTKNMLQHGHVYTGNSIFCVLC